MKAILWKSADKLRSQAKQPEIGAMIDAAMDGSKEKTPRCAANWTSVLGAHI